MSFFEPTPPKEIPKEVKQYMDAHFTNIQSKLDDLYSLVRRSQMQSTYTIVEVAKLTNSTRQTVSNHIKNGILTASKIGRKVCIKHEDLEKYLNNKINN